MYTGTGFPSDYGLGVLDYSAGVMVEHVAVFECVSGDSLNIPRIQTDGNFVRSDLQAMQIFERIIRMTVGTYLSISSQASAAPSLLEWADIYLIRPPQRELLV